MKKTIAAIMLLCLVACKKETIKVSEPTPTPVYEYGSVHFEWSDQEIISMSVTFNGLTLTQSNIKTISGGADYTALLGEYEYSATATYQHDIYKKWSGRVKITKALQTIYLNR